MSIAMNRLFAIIIAFVVIAPAAAEEQPLRFVHALQQHGYGDMAVDYLETLAKRPDLAPEVREVWDLEMSKSLVAAAADAFDLREKEQLLKQSREHLAKFIREHPNHPATAVATASWGDFLLKQALESIRSAKAAEKGQQEKDLAEARTDLGHAREKFQQAQQEITTRLAELPPPSKLPARKAEREAAIETRAEAEANLQEAQLQLAMIDYYLAQTYLDPKSDDRAEALKKAAQAFDGVFQRSRANAAGLSVAGLYAHLWHGKTVEELGDLSLALDIYDEVLANAPDPGEKAPSTGLEPLFTQAEYFRLLILAKQKPEQFLSEAASWLQFYRRLKQTDGYQGIALELAKTTLALADRAAGPDKVKRLADALRILAEMAKVRSPYQREAVLMRRDVLKTMGKSDLDAGTFEEAVALGDAAAADARWPQALDAYNKALEIAEKNRRNDASGVAAVRDALAGVQVMIARDLFIKGDYNQCIEMARGIVFEDPHDKVVRKDANSARASALAVAAALNLYAEAPDAQKPAALEKLTRLAEFTEKNWPDRPEADDARMARGQAKLVVGQVREAIDIFERVNPKSARYAVAMCMAGQNYWRLYVTEKLKSGVHDDRQMAADRAKAVERLTSGLEILKRQADAGTASKAFIDAQLLLAEIRYEGGDAEGAAALYQPLVDITTTEKPQTLDEGTLRIFLGAVRAYCAAGNLDKAASVGGMLIELGPDTPPVNAVLVDFAKLLSEERKKADAQVTEMESTTDDPAPAKARLAFINALLGKILTKLADRREVSLAGMVFIGDALSAVGMTADASRQYEKIIHRAEADAEFAKVAEKAVTRVRAHLVDLLRKEGKYEESLKQVDLLLKDHSNSLELLMEKGLILQEWSEMEPAHFNEAVAHWVMLRSRLQALRKKPPEYYDVMYNVAACLIREAETSKDKATAMDRAKEAERVLKSPLILSPRLNGPDMVARYKVLLNKAISMQGRSPERKDEK
jgi:hypothetical protein